MEPAWTSLTEIDAPDGPTRQPYGRGVATTPFDKATLATTRVGQTKAAGKTGNHKTKGRAIAVNSNGRAQLNLSQADFDLLLRSLDKLNKLGRGTGKQLRAQHQRAIAKGEDRRRRVQVWLNLQELEAAWRAIQEEPISPKQKLRLAKYLSTAHRRARRAMGGHPGPNPAANSRDRRARHVTGRERL